MLRLSFRIRSHRFTHPVFIAKVRLASSIPPPHPSTSTASHIQLNSNITKTELETSTLKNTVQFSKVPTKQELLSNTSSFLGRLKIRSKWALTRSNRPFRADDYSAFFSWLFLGHVIWIVLGTTTFFSLALAAVNTVSAQEYLASKIGEYITSSSGITVVFESAIVPKWKDGFIQFHNVFVSRRPKSLALPSGVRKGSLSVATAEAAAKLTPHSLSIDHDHGDPIAEKEDMNYTQFDLTIETVNVTLSFIQWWNGKGLLKDIDIKGVRGVVDRTFVHWNATTTALDPLSFRHESAYGDFELDSLKLEDLLVTVHQPNNFRPFTASIFSADLPRLRKQWLFYDFLSANHVSGSFDNSLITLHPKQSFNPSSETKKVNRLRVDNIAIDHLNGGVKGAMGWITEGTVDIVADISIPQELNSANLVEDLVQNIVESVHPHLSPLPSSPPQTSSSTPSLSSSSSSSSSSSNTLSSSSSSSGTSRYTDECDNSRGISITRRRRDIHEDIIIDIYFRLNDAKASIPLLSDDLSYVNSALVRPIIAYINSRKTFIPITARVGIPFDNFNGSWTWFDCGLLGSVSMALYEAFVEGLYEAKKRRRRISAVGFWSLQVAAQVLVVSLKNFVPAHG